MIFRRALDVPPFKDYHRYRLFLQRDFEFRCAYCLRPEFFFGGGEAGEIDHHRPVRLFPQLINDYGNLYWCCRVCNAAKSGRWPSADQLAHGFRFLDPCADDHDNHWQALPDGTLTPTTAIGQYTIRHIRLDRPALIEFRNFLTKFKEQVRAIEEELLKTNLSLEKRSELVKDLETVAMLAEPGLQK